MPLRPPRFYPIVNVRGDGSDGSELQRATRLANTLARAGSTLVQLRAKELAAGRSTELACALVESLGRLGCRLVVNDRVDVALAAGAAGVHLGDEDFPVADARALLGDGAIIGYSTHALSEVKAAPPEADYLGFGPVFESPTKAGVRRPRGLDALAEACAASALPVVAIGGITLATAPRAWRAGAASVAIIREIEATADVAALVRAYTAAGALDR